MKISILAATISIMEFPVILTQYTSFFFFSMNTFLLLRNFSHGLLAEVCIKNMPTEIINFINKSQTAFSKQKKESFLLVQNFGLTR